MRTPLLLIATLLVASNALAHHGTNGQFDHSKSLQVHGVVTKLRFVNPHSYVYFDVTNEDGSVDNWRCEMRAATVLKRSGWSADMFSAGTQIRIDGLPARREPHGCYVETITFDNGESIERYQQLEGAEGSVSAADRPATLENGQPNISGDWAAPQRLLTAEQVKGRVRNGFGRPRYAQSAAGKAAVADFDTDRDNPRFHCQAVNIFADWTFDQHINRVEQTDTAITLAYGFMDIVRTIHLDTAKHPDDIISSRAGHSIGKWDGNTLIVDTVGLAEGYLEGRAGVKHSDQLHAVELFTFDPNEVSLSRSYIIDDPKYLTEKFQGQDQVFLSGTPFDPYNCEDLTTEIVEGF